MNFETMNLNFRTLHSGMFAEQEGEVQAGRGQRGGNQRTCESCLLDLLVEIKKENLFSMGGLLSPGSPAAPAWGNSLHRHGELSYSSIW